MIMMNNFFITDSELFANNLNYGTFIGDIDCKQLKMVKKTMRKALSGNFEINDRPCRLMWTEKLITKVSADILCMATNEPHGYLGASVSVRLERPDARNPYQSLCSFRFDEHAPQMIEITLTLPVVERYSLFSCSSISAVISSYVCCQCKAHQSFALIGEAYLLVKEKRYIPYSASPALSGNWIDITANILIVSLSFRQIHAIFYEVLDFFNEFSLIWMFLTFLLHLFCRICSFI